VLFGTLPRAHIKKYLPRGGRPNVWGKSDYDFGFLRKRQCSWGNQVQHNTFAAEQRLHGLQQYDSADLTIQAISIA
jgi:hypothetical protein